MNDIVITYPPELLPCSEPGDEVEVYAQEIMPGDGCLRNCLVWSSEFGVSAGTTQPWGNMVMRRGRQKANVS